MKQLIGRHLYRFALSFVCLGLQGSFALAKAPAIAANGCFAQDDSAQVFRAIFSQELANTYAYDQALIASLILHPTPELTAPFEIHDSEAPFAEFDSRLAQISPRDLYEAGYKQGFSTPSSELEGVRDIAPAEPATIVLVAGIANELMVAPPFPSVLQGESHFKREWQNLIDGLSPDQRRFRVYSWQEFRDMDVDIGELFQAGSIDAADGRPIVRYLFVVPAYGSLDTVGDVDSMASALDRRLAQLFAVLPHQPHLYLAGYSQGANVIVNLAARQGGQPSPWFHEVKGLLSLAGPLFGTPLANGAQQAGTPSYELFAALDELRDGLIDEYHSVLEIPGIFLKNTLLWHATLKKVSAAHERYGAMHTGHAGQGTQASPLLLLDILKTFGGTFLSLGPKTPALWQYFGHIKRLKLMLGKTLEAARALSDSARLAWWRTHELPPHLKYLAIAGVMASAQERGHHDPLASAPGAGIETVDFGFLRGLFYDIYWATGIDLNDSQVTLRQAMFWPDVHQAINPRQQPYRAHNLGILATHHWGIAIPGSVVPEGDHANRFPREGLLKSLGLTILALDAKE